MEFEKFLKEKRKIVIEPVLIGGSTHKPKRLMPNAYISESDLGELALKQKLHFRKLALSEKTPERMQWYYSGIEAEYEKIAVACLGKETIEKRLKEEGFE